MPENTFCSPKRFNYTGSILHGAFSNSLKRKLAHAITHLDALEKVGTPLIPYIAAWMPDGGHVWYEYAGPRLHALLAIQSTELAMAFRENIINRCLYRVQRNPPSIDKIIRDRQQIDRMRQVLRRLAERGREVEAVYKVDVKGNPVWLKDLARIEKHGDDRIVLSYGTLIDVTKEMQLEEALTEVKVELQLHKENLESLVEARTRDLKKSQLDVINRLAQAAACRDDETGSHIKRLSRYCAVIGKAYGLSNNANRILFHAVPMHDIGKLGIADAILRKQGALSPDEFEVIKSHCKVGADLLNGGQQSPLLQVAQTIALTHHERWDGSGYPQGLAEGQIPLASRITAISDVFDALTSERPYKKAWIFDRAVDEVRSLRGVYFDPKLVDLFMQNIKTIRKAYQITPQGLPVRIPTESGQHSGGKAATVPI